jgi:hypothetical protein
MGKTPIFSSCWDCGDERGTLLRLSYSKTRVAVPSVNALKWIFPQEKATLQALGKGTLTLVLI